MKSRVTDCAIAIPILVGLLGLFYAFTTPIGEYDVMGAGFYFRVALSLLLASIIAIGLSVWAYQRKEPSAT